MSNVLTRKEVYEVIDTERAYQDKGSGNALRHDGMPAMTPGEMILCMEKLVNDAREAWYVPEGGLGCREHVRKVAGVAVQMMERYGAPKRK